ncbi:YrbL family protein [Marinobacter fonticola]|uniref:YrbL family protein n=1 Tax=Marinobacter fonticola TaxID=2603215 RepID=UPI0011E8381D|nr:YrbL family protein [Marinobacter fonticola]
MIDLTRQEPFAAGYNRTCYIHPDDPSRCLKVLRPENIERRFARQPWYKKLLGKTRINDNLQEQAAHSQPAVANGTPLVWAHLPRFYGSEPTTLGPANVSELITNPDRTPCITLEAYLHQHGLDKTIHGAIDRFCRWLRETKILTRNLLPHNLVVATRQHQLELYLVDGLGAPTVPTALSHSAAYRDRYIDRKIQRFGIRIDWETGGRQGPWASAEKL